MVKKRLSLPTLKGHPGKLAAFPIMGHFIFLIVTFNEKPLI